MATITIVGGETAQTAFPGTVLSSPLNAAAQDAMTALGQGFVDSQVFHSRLHAPGSPGPLYVYNVAGGPPPFHLPAGAQAVILTGHKPTTIIGHVGTEVLIGNEGKDTIAAGGGTGTMIGGDAGN